METIEKRHAKRLTSTSIDVVKNRKTTIKKHTTMHTQNTIKSILSVRGFERVVPTDDVLRNLDMTLHRFNKIIENKVKMTLEEAAAFALWLNVSIEDLTTVPTQNLADKFGLNN